MILTEDRALTDLIIIRGLPGSGKTTIAKMFEAHGYMHCEADKFMFEDGKEYEHYRIQEVHDKCLRQVRNFLKNGERVVVSNTFSRMWEFSRYLGITPSLTVIKVIGNFNSVHNVPEHDIERMKNQWEDYHDEIVIDNTKL